MTDRRLTPARPDLAAAYLKGQVQAQRFSDGALHRVTAARAALRPKPDPGLALDTELLHGEPFVVYDTSDGWAWGQSALDGYVGYVPARMLGAPDAPPSHAVDSLGAQVYAAPALKSPPGGHLPFGARVHVHETRDAHARIGPDQWVPAPLLRPLDAPVDDWVATAERFVGVPYVWGGRSSAGLDCSALVQLARQSADLACPRDSDMQEAAPGTTLGDNAPLQRGDLVFWKGHVGIMTDPDGLLHANAYHRQVTAEPLTTTIARIAQQGDGQVTRRVRLDERPANG